MALAIHNEGSNISASHLSAQPPFGSKRHRTGPVRKCSKEQGEGEKKRAKLSVYSLHSGLFIQSEGGGCVDFMSLLGENY